MHPDRTNYEIWFIDYLDGLLDETRVNQLFSFLDENPDLKEEFESLSQYYIEPGDNFFPGKNKLKKSFTDLSVTQFEFLCIAASENDLTVPQRDELNEIISENNYKKKTYDLINSLKLVPPNLNYKRKSALRKLSSAQKIVRLSIIGLSAAAGIALMISLFNESVKNAELKQLISTNSSGVSNKIKALKNTAVSNINTPEKREILHPGRTNVLFTPNKTIVAELKASPVKSAAIDSFAGTQKIERMNISTIDFKNEVIVLEKHDINTLMPINPGKISSTITPEKPGFNGFIAKIFREKIFKSSTPETGFLKAYEIADAGINGLNKVLGWQMSLQKTRDVKGDIKSLYFSSKILKFNAPVKKVQL